MIPDKNDLKENKKRGLTEEAEDSIRIIDSFFSKGEERKEVQLALDRQWRKDASEMAEGEETPEAEDTAEPEPTVDIVSADNVETAEEADSEKSEIAVDSTDDENTGAPAETDTENDSGKDENKPSELGAKEKVNTNNSNRSEGIALPIMGSIIIIALIVLIMILTGCSAKGDESAGALDSFAVSDMSGYKALSNYEKETVFVDVTMDDVDTLMKEKKTFALFAGFANCPWCNALIPYLNDAALEAGVKMAYIDTRRDPSWKTNLDLEGYDIFTGYFGEYLDIDDEGKPHLYVPDVYFIKNGEVVARHEGVTPGLQEPTDIMTDEQKAELMAKLAEEFSAMAG